MRQPMLSKNQLQAINKQALNYPLAIAEKDYFLALVSKIIYNSPLREKIIFKGGTALHHCYLDQFRFSEDLDFGSRDKNISIEEVKAVLEENEFLTIKKEYSSNATIKLEKVQYAGPLGLPNSLKLEIDYLQDVVLPAKDLEYRNVWGIQTKVNVMDIKEICAEKIRATSDRVRYRDFYDLVLIIENFNLDLKKIVELAKKKEIRKPISKNTILENWRIVREEREKEESAVYYFKPIDDKKVEEILKALPFDILR